MMVVENEYLLPLGRRPTVDLAGMSSHMDGVGRYRIATWSLHFFLYSGVLEIDETSYPFDVGCYALTPPNSDLVFHRDAPGPWKHACCLFRCTAELSPPSRQGVAAPCRLPVVMDRAESLDEEIELLDRIIRTHSVNTLRAELLLWELLLRLQDMFPGKTDFEQSTEPEVLCKFRERSERLIECGVNCRALAQALGVSYDCLNRLAKRYWGTTLKAHVMERQIERAVYMLLNTTMPVKTIALSCGFNDSQHLNKTMRKKQGQSPSRIRRRDI